MALKKWSGVIGYQPVVVKTDHKSLENWVTEHVDTPSGPAGRRARWHEMLSKFDIKVVYNPGKDNLVADALSRWAYPASQGLADVSKHGNLESTLEAKEIIEEEKREEKESEKLVGIVTVDRSPHMYCREKLLGKSSDGTCQVGTKDLGANNFSKDKKMVGIVELEEEVPVMLDLFSGTGSVGEVYRRHGFKVISIDWDKKFNPTIVQDVLSWDYKKAFPKTIFIQFLRRYRV